MMVPSCRRGIGGVIEVGRATIMLLALDDVTTETGCKWVSSRFKRFILILFPVDEYSISEINNKTERKIVTSRKLIRLTNNYLS
jgi:hypothetical protein